MPETLEREIKLRFADAGAARAAVRATGATQIRPRRLQQDCLLDTADGRLRERRSALRVRSEPGGGSITLKGPVRPAAMKLREELETTVGNGPVLVELLERMGFQVWFRYEKYREEFALGDCIVAIDETPVGTFIEIEGTEPAITAAADALGRQPGEYILDSYRGLFARQCEERGVPVTDMLFGQQTPV